MKFKTLSRATISLAFLTILSAPSKAQSFSEFSNPVTTYSRQVATSKPLNIGRHGSIRKIAETKDHQNFSARYAPQGGNLLSIAKRYDGAGKVTRLPGAWCRDFINMVATKAGIHLKNASRRAIDALGLGPHVSSPQPGDLVVMRSHVTIFAGKAGGKIVGLGGNQHHGVRYSGYNPRKVLAYVRVASR
jgi:uncharacterized protein (TIGR02594 family)